jgi:hypothetical protein
MAKQAGRSKQADASERTTTPKRWVTQNPKKILTGHLGQPLVDPLGTHLLTPTLTSIGPSFATSSIAPHAHQVNKWPLSVKGHVA